jgi:Zn-dependent protease
MEFLNSLDPVTIIIITILIFSIIIHEMAHGYAALFLGDDTAERAGRLTLNPIPHLDPIGSILLPAIFILSASPFFFGYAKPVPYNPSNLRNKKWGDAIVALAGPLSNLILALIFTIITGILFYLESGSEATLKILTNAAFLNIFLAVLNLIPLPPLDGSKILLDILKNNSLGIYHKVRIFFSKYQLVLFLILLLFVIYTDFLPRITESIFNFYQSLIF